MILETLLLFVSVLINLLFLFYSRWLIRIIRTKEEEATEIYETILNYTAHVKSVHDMEMFYGDQTLKSLIDHGTALLGDIENMDFLLTDEDPEIEQREE
jgi:hypothetical protein|tara:strand:- start:811 stop:1107 length:297 start_codon:yes stop_codon:yes gene_type:complete